MKHFSFLICSERSGGNFITALLNGHSRICGPPPSHLFRLFISNRGNYGSLDQDENWDLLIEDLRLNAANALGRWRTITTADDLRAEATNRSLGELLRIIYEREADYDRASHVFVKENQTSTFAAFLIAHFPESRFLWMVRDPRDVASSWLETAAMPGGVAEAVDAWLRDQVATTTLYHQLRDTGRILLTSYERLVTEPVRVLTAITRWLGLDFEDRMLAFYRDLRTLENSYRIEAWSNLRRPVMRGNTGKFRDRLNRYDQLYVETACFQQMRFLGYDCELIHDTPEDADRRLQELRPRLSPVDKKAVSNEERSIRDQRLAAMAQVLSRRL